LADRLSTHFNGFCLLAPNSFEGGLLRKVQDLSYPTEPIKQKLATALF